MMVRDRILVITDLFLGALWADDEFNEDEQRAVRQLLAQLLEVEPDALPDPVETRIREFEPLSFELELAAEEFGSDGPMAKRRLLELVGRLVHADGVVDLREDEYLRRFARALGIDEAECTDLVFDYEPEELRGHFEQLRVPPPPMVDGKGKSTKPPPPPIVDAVAAPVMNAPSPAPLPGPPPMVPRDDGDEG